MDFSLNIGMLAASARDIAGQTLVKLGEDHPEVVIVNADLATSTRTTAFVEKFPERSFNVGIAEANMVSVASGMAREGLRPIVLTMAPFLSMRACEQVRTDVCYGKVPVIMLGTYAGYSGGISGATHSGLEDCAIMNSFGGMTVLEPGDPWLIAKMIEAAYELNAPVYMRLGVEAQKPIYDFDKVEYHIGKARARGRHAHHQAHRRRGRARGCQDRRRRVRTGPHQDRWFGRPGGPRARRERLWLQVQDPGHARRVRAAGHDRVFVSPQ